jgi:hypothetical protein
LAEEGIDAISWRCLNIFMGAEDTPVFLAKGLGANLRRAKDIEQLS